MNKTDKLLEIIPEDQQHLREVMQETDDQQGTLMSFIGWPTDQWHWDALVEITGKPYEVLQPEMEPYD